MTHAQAFRAAFCAAFRVLGNRTDSEDAAQEALVTALVRPDAPEAWIRAVARHKALDLYRRREAKRTLELESWYLAPARVDLVELRDEVEVLLRRLAQSECRAGPHYARVLRLRFLEDGKVPKMLVHRAIAAARKAVEA